MTAIELLRELIDSSDAFNVEFSSGPSKQEEQSEEHKRYNEVYWKAKAFLAGVDASENK